MKKIRWITGILLVLCLIFPVMTGMNSETVLAGQPGSNKYVADQANLLSDRAKQELEDKLRQMSAKWNQDFVVVTTDDAEGKDSEEYADDYYDNNGYQENGVLYLVDLDNGNVWISTAGAMIRFLTDRRIDSVIDAGYEDLHEKNYAAGFLAMLKCTDRYMEEGIQDNQYTYDVETGKISRHYALSAGEILVALVIALACGGAFFGITNARYKMKMGNYSYPFQEKGQVRYTRREDILVNQTITRRKIPKNPPSGGGGGGQSSVHTSSGGVSHGGGGRSL